MAIDKKAIAAMGRKKKAKMPKASTKDLKAIEVAGVSDDLKFKLFGGFAYHYLDSYSSYMDFRKQGMNPSKAYQEVYEMSMDEIAENDPSFRR
jgi:hypothetical protein